MAKDADDDAVTDDPATWRRSRGARSDVITYHVRYEPDWAGPLATTQSATEPASLSLPDPFPPLKLSDPNWSSMRPSPLASVRWAAPPPRVSRAATSRPHPSVMRLPARSPLYGAPLTPREALVTTLLEQTAGSTLDAPLARMLLDDPLSPVKQGDLGSMEKPDKTSTPVLEIVRQRAPEPPPPSDEPAPSSASTLHAKKRERSESAPPTWRSRLGGWKWLANALRAKPRPAPSREEKEEETLLVFPPAEPPEPDVLDEIDALDRRGQRVRAIEAARERLASSDDPRVAERLAALEAHLVRAPSLRVEWDGRPLRVVFEETATLGRLDADIQVAHPEISRRHLLLGRREGGFFAKDAGSHNGVFVEGARMGAREIAFDSAIRLDLARSIACELTPLDDALLAVDVGGERTLVAFEGRARLGGWLLERRRRDDGFLYSLTSATPMRLRGEDVLAIELAHGDAIRDGEVVRLRVELANGDNAHAPRSVSY